MGKIFNQLWLTAIILLTLGQFTCEGQSKKMQFFGADHALIQYTGRIDFSDPRKPRFWSPGVYIQAKFKGSSCEITLNDEELWGKNHNYLEIAIDNSEPFRIQTTGKTNVIKVAEGLSKGAHTLTICKNTEANIGYLEFVGISCEKLLPLPAKPARKIEFFGNSITCGTGADLSKVDCGKGEWHDQHNAYLSYGPTVARELKAQWQLSSVSGIGLIHSCCDLEITMPDVFDKVSMRDNKIKWDFQQYQPDVVTICLGQNDGIQDSTAFCGAYVKFIGELRKVYPKAQIVCLTSPMGDANLTAALKNYLTAVVTQANQSGDKNVHQFFYSRSYTSGCDSHPDLQEHQLIAKELSAFLKGLMKW